MSENELTREEMCERTRTQLHEQVDKVVAAWLAGSPAEMSVQTGTKRIDAGGYWRYESTGERMLTLWWYENGYDAARGH